jgi:hypothetical protein
VNPPLTPPDGSAPALGYPLPAIKLAITVAK